MTGVCERQVRFDRHHPLADPDRAQGRRQHRAAAPGRVRARALPPVRRPQVRHRVPGGRARQERRHRRHRLGRLEVRRLPAVHHRLHLRRHRARRAQRPRQQVRHLRGQAGLRARLPHRRAAPRHHRAHLQRGRQLGRPLRPRPGRLPGLQHRAADAPRAAPCRPRHRARHPAGLRPGNGLGGLQRHHRHQGAGLPPAAHQHRGDARRGQAPVRARRPQGHRDGDRRRRRRLGRRASSRSRARPSAASASSSWWSTTRAA